METVAKNSDFFRELVANDVLIYHYELVDTSTPERVSKISCKITQVEKVEEYEMFKDSFLKGLRKDYFPGVSLASLRLFPFFLLDPASIQAPSIERMDKKREKR